MKIWKIQLAFWGVMLWLGSFQLSEYLRGKGWAELHLAASGYMIGFITAFSGYLIWEVINGRGRDLLDQHPFWRVFSIFPLLILVCIGVAGFYNEMFGSSPWYYNVTFFLANFIVGKALIPVIHDLDGRKNT